MNAAERHIEFPPHVRERLRQSLAPPDQDVIVAAAQIATGREPDDLAQSTPHAIALHGIANLPRYGEAHAHRTTFFLATTRLQHERAAGRPHACRSGAKIGPAPQPLHGISGNGARSRAKPFAAAGAPRREHSAAAFRRHPGAKAMAALAHQFAGLIGPFHGIGLRYAPGLDRPVEGSAAARLWRGLYGSPLGPSTEPAKAPKGLVNKRFDGCSALVFPRVAFRCIE